jgi:methylmalonyl-CoA mutase N-terminal domain/subunit
MLRFHVQTGGATLTEQQPLNNITRVTIQALAAVLGGCQSLHACSYDEALALPSEAAVQLSLRTQQVIAHESGIADTVDPLGGSYYVEALTNQVEEEAMNYIKRIDEMGGAVGSIEAGFMQREIANSSYNHQKAVDSGEQIVVGLNDFKEEEETEVEIFAIDPTTEKRQVERLDKLRAERDGGAVKEVLERVRQTAETDENVMPVLIEAVKAHATVGEISDALRAVFGDYREPNIL